MSETGKPSALASERAALLDVTGERRGFDWSAIPPWVGTLAALALLVVLVPVGEYVIRDGPATVGGFFSWLLGGDSAFLSPNNWMNILSASSELGVVAVGMTLVIILGGIDLSVGSLLALAGGVGVLAGNAVLATGWGEGTELDITWRFFRVQLDAGQLLGLAAVLCTTIAVASLAGVFNGSLIAVGRLAPFIVTLGTLVAFRAGSTWAADGGYFASESEYLGTLGRGVPIPGTDINPRPRITIPMQLPYAFLIWMLTAAAGALILRLTPLGRYIVAIGANERAAVYSAVPVTAVKVATYTLLGVTVGVAACLHSGRFESVNSAQSGLLLELEVIAAVVLGGTSMRGGYGSIFGCVVGVLLIGVLKNAMVMLDIGSHPQGVVMGAIIIVAVLIQRVGTRQ